jgi:hypothetical protein
MHDDGYRQPTSPRTRRLGAREALAVIAVAALVLVLFEGPSIKRSGERMDPGVLRTMVLAVGGPAAAIAERLPLAEVGDEATGWLKADSDLAAADDATGFDEAGPAETEVGVPAVPPGAFDPVRDLGAEAPEPRALRRLMITGDSMVMPLDAVLARRMTSGQAVSVVRDPHLGSGISKPGIVDWGRLSGRQTVQHRPDAVVFFLGANEGFPMAIDGEEVECCDARWAAEYAFRTRQMMNTYRQEGRGRVYWVTLPLPRSGDLARVARVVNAAIRVAAQPYRSDVRVVELQELFTPGDRYRDSMPVDGEERLVRDGDGIHLNDTGAEVAADQVLEALTRDFSVRVTG